VSEASSAMSINIPCSKESVDVFTSPTAKDILDQTRNASANHGTHHFTGFFYQTSTPEIPVGPSTHFVAQFPVTQPIRRTMVTEVCDDESVLAFRFGMPSKHQDLVDGAVDVEDHHESDIEGSGTSLPSERTQIRSDGNDTPSVAKGKCREAPSVIQAMKALDDLKVKLCPQCEKGAGYKDPDLDPFTQARLEGKQTLLSLYTDMRSATHGQWAASSLQAALSLLRGRYCAQILWRLVWQFIEDRTVLPVNPYGDWNESMLVDEDLAQDIGLYLQELGKEITAEKLIAFLTRPEVKDKHEITKKISVWTAQHYLRALGYRWKEALKGQYSDGHEQSDVVWDCNKNYLPKIKILQARMQAYSKDGIATGARADGKWVVVWYHDESIFYAHDHHRKTWYHKDTPAKPYQKGDGHSLMIADFMSADFRWLQSFDGKRSARHIMRPGKNRDGYFTMDDIEAQVQNAMDILTNEFPSDFEHVFVYDNATTYKKQAEGTPSACNMPKNTPAEGRNWLIEVMKCGADGKAIYTQDGSLEKVKVQMKDATFTDGTPQPLYFPEGHPCAGVFKGMVTILEERGFTDMHKKQYKCDSFKCAPPAIDCCCHCLLFNQLDFTNVKSILELACETQGFQVIYLPKFHCKLNPIEQCWGYAKWVYHLNPESSREDVLEWNALSVLGSIPLASVHHFSNRSLQFMDAYSRGLTGSQAAWAARKYRGHRVLPDTIMNEIEKANLQ
jgi:hypothetical protein